MAEPTVGDPPRIDATAVADRAPAPDLARGAMLLLIALANAHLYLYWQQPVSVRGYPASESVPDRIVVLAQLTLVDGRAYPMFAALFGYGIVQWLRRLTARGVDGDTVRGLVRRRGWWLVLFGFVHALLLFSGDILGAYGLLAVVLGGLLIRASERTLLLMAVLWTVPAAALGAMQALPLPGSQTAILPSMALTDPVGAAASRVAEWVALTVMVAAFSLVPALLLGAWAARRRILDDPERHRPLLVRTAVGGVTLAVLGGLPLALIASSGWEPSVQVVLLAGAAHALGGYAGGAGYAALAGLVAIRTRQRRGPVVRALTACGQRSLTCYLAQSVVFVAVLAAYGGGLGDRLGLAQTAALAAGTWLLTVLLADALARAGLRGPAEVVLRRLTYSRTRG